MTSPVGTVYRTRRWRHLRQVVRASRRRTLGRLGWRVGVLTSAWALPVAIVRDYAADCVMIHVLCVAVRVWWTPGTPGGR
jgi:hypothetical protein